MIQNLRAYATWPLKSCARSAKKSSTFEFAGMSPLLSIIIILFIALIYLICFVSKHFSAIRSIFRLAYSSHQAPSLCVCVKCNQKILCYVIEHLTLEGVWSSQETKDIKNQMTCSVKAYLCLMQGLLGLVIHSNPSETFTQTQIHKIIQTKTNRYRIKLPLPFYCSELNGWGWKARTKRKSEITNLYQ